MLNNSATKNRPTFLIKFDVYACEHCALFSAIAE